MIKGAMYCLLSDRFKAGRLLVVDTFELEEIRTKRLNQILRKQLELDKVLIVDTGKMKVKLGLMHMRTNSFSLKTRFSHSPFENFLYLVLKIMYEKAFSFHIVTHISFCCRYQFCFSTSNHV